MLDAAWIDARARALRERAREEETARSLRRARPIGASNSRARPGLATAPALRSAGAGTARSDLDDIPRGKGRALLRAPARSPRDEGARSVGSAGRSPAAKLAAGYQPAVLKVISYGHGVTRATAIGQYVQRGEAALETHEGKLLATHEAVAAEMKEWSRGFDKRRPSDDVATFRVAVRGEGSLERLTDVAQAGFAGHRFAYRLDPHGEDGPEVRVVAAMAGHSIVRGENGDDKVAERFHTARSTARPPAFTPPTRDLIASRVAEALGVSAESVSVTPDGPPGHGKAGVAHHLARLARRGDLTGQDGAPLRSEQDIQITAQAWDRTLNSFAPRDVMHMILSAKAGEDKDALVRAARGFLHEQFSDHKFAFALHDDKVADGHLHVHAVVAVKGDDGQRLRPGPADLRAWRQTYAEHAEAQGLRIVAVSAAQRASSQSYGPRDKAIVAIAERPRSDRENRDRSYAQANPGLVERARQRMERARINPVRLPTSVDQLRVTSESLVDWQSVQAARPADPFVGHFVERLTQAQALGKVLVAVQDFRRGGEMADATAAEMRENLRDLNEAVSGAADMLQGSSRSEFLRRTGETMEMLAIRTDAKAKLEAGRTEITEEEARQLAGPHAEALIARAWAIQAAEAREAEQADAIRDRAIEQEVRDERSGSTDPASLAQIAEDRIAVRAAESIAQRERGDVRAAAEAIRELSKHPQQHLGPEAVEGARLEELRRQQERSTAINTTPLDAEEPQAEKPASQRM